VDKLLFAALAVPAKFTLLTAAVELVGVETVVSEFAFTCVADILDFPDPALVAWLFLTLMPEFIFVVGTLFVDSNEFVLSDKHV
jgi:hypothetical protein